MEFSRPGLSEKLVPGVRSECCDRREPSLCTAEIDRAKDSREISAERAHDGVALLVRLNADNKKYRGTGEWRKDGLRNRCWIFSAGWAHTNSLNLCRQIYNPKYVQCLLLEINAKKRAEGYEDLLNLNHSTKWLQR